MGSVVCAGVGTGARYCATAGLLALIVLSGCGRLGFEPFGARQVAADDAGQGGGLVDAALADGGAEDSGADTGSADAATMDAAMLDAAVTDAAGTDAAAVDGATVDAAADAALSDSGTDAAVATCSDTIQNGDETGVDCGGTVCPTCPVLGANTPPVAQIAITPGTGHHDTASPTLFMADASGSWDVEDAPGDLVYAWDWSNDGVFEASGVTPAANIYPAPGSYTAVLRVTDTEGLSGYAEFLLVVRAQSDVIVVASPDDPTPSTGPGPTLRQAIAQANATAGRQSILIPSGMVVVLTSPMIDSTDAAGLDVVGDGAVIEGMNLTGSEICLEITSSGNIHLGLELRNCPASPYQVSGNNNTFARGYVHHNGSAVRYTGSSNTFGPGNEVSYNSSSGVEVLGPNRIERSAFSYHTSNGILLSGSSDGTVLIGNTLYSNQVGIRLTNGANDNIVLHNTLVDNGAGQVAIGNSTTGIVMRNNLVAHGTGYGMTASAGSFAAFDHNFFYSNPAGHCSGCLGMYGAGSVLDMDPQLVNLLMRDLRLLPTSPAVNVGADTGYDVNGAITGNGTFYGSAPDMGAWETP